MNFNNRHLPLMSAVIFAVLMQDELVKLRAAKDPDVDDEIVDSLQDDAVRLAGELYRKCGSQYAGPA